MKKLILILSIFIVNTALSQIVKNLISSHIKSEGTISIVPSSAAQPIMQNSTIESGSSVTFTCTSLELDNSSIKGGKITIAAGVTTLIIKGVVKIQATELILENNSTTLTIDTQNPGSTLILTYSDRITGTRTITIDDLDRNAVTILKK